MAQTIADAAEFSSVGFPGCVMAMDLKWFIIFDTIYYVLASIDIVSPFVTVTVDEILTRNTDFQTSWELWTSKGSHKQTESSCDEDDGQFISRETAIYYTFDNGTS